MLTNLNSPFVTSQRIRTLTITKLPRCATHITESEAFATLIRGLQTLKVSFLAAPRYETTGVPIVPMEDVGIYASVPDTWLTKSVNLSCLELSANGPWGFHPRLDFRKVYFPHLRKLGLGGFAFSHDWQLRWILSHASHLRILYLTNCTIQRLACIHRHDMDSEGYPLGQGPNCTGREAGYHRHDRYWCEYFEVIRRYMTGLLDFDFGDPVKGDHPDGASSALDTDDEAAATLPNCSYDCFMHYAYTSMSAQDVGNHSYWLVKPFDSFRKTDPKQVLSDDIAGYEMLQRSIRGTRA